MVARQVVSDEAQGHGHGGGRRRVSSVWKDFHRNVVVDVSGAGGCTATCRRCGTTLQASTKTCGTSHLRRHAKSGACAKRAAAAQAQRGPPPPPPEPAGDGNDDGPGASPPNYVPLPQVSSSSSTRFFKKKRDRHSYRGSAREIHEGRRPSSAAEPQLCRPEEKAASDKYYYDEENFKDLPSILSSGWEIDSVSDSGTSNPPQEPAAGPAPCPPSPQPAAAASISLPIGNMFLRQEMKSALKQFFQKRREKRNKQRARHLADSTTT